MTEQILEYLDYAGHGLSLFAVGVIVIDFALAAGRYLLGIGKAGPEKDFQSFKVELGGALTLGLEILVLADIIETITTEPTFMSLGMLSFLVVVRTALSWTLALEIEGRWPWQKAEEPEAEKQNDKVRDQRGKDVNDA